MKMMQKAMRACMKQIAYDKHTMLEAYQLVNGTGFCLVSPPTVSYSTSVSDDCSILPEDPITQTRMALEQINAKVTDTQRKLKGGDKNAKLDQR